MCRYGTALYKGLEHPQILEPWGVSNQCPVDTKGWVHTSHMLVMMV